MMVSRRFIWCVLSILMLVSLILKGFHLSPDLLVHGDEARYLSEARLFARLPGGFYLLYAKPLFSALLAIGLTLFKNEIVGAQWVQVLMATLWIPVLFLLAERLTGRRIIALLAAFFATVDPWIFHYARHLFPEPLSGLLWMASFYFLICEEKLKKRHYALSGFFFGLSITGNYRMFLVLPFHLLFLLWTQQETLKDRFKQALIWSGTVILPLVLWEGAYFLFLSLFVPQSVVPQFKRGYLDQLFYLVHFHSLYGLRKDSWWTYFFLLKYYEGIPLLLSLGAGVVCVLRGPIKRLKVFLICSYFLPLSGFAFSYFPFARFWGSLLFWHPLLASLGIFSISQWLGQRFSRGFVMGMIILPLVVGIGFLPRWLLERSFNIPYEESLSWMEKNEDSLSKVATSLPSLIKQLRPSWKIFGLEKFEENELIRLRILGVRFFLLIEGMHHIHSPDPYQSLVVEEDRIAKGLNSFCPVVFQASCTSPAEYWATFAWEHNVRSQDTLHFLETGDLDRVPCLKIYDINNCSLPQSSME